MVGQALTQVWAVIPTYKRDDMLDRCVRTLKEQGVEHVIVVRDKAPTHVARNSGIELAPDDAILFSVDDDCWYDERLRLAETVERMSADTGVVQVTRIMPGRTGMRVAPAHMNRSPLCWTGGGLLFRKRIWAEVGGFPADYLDDVMFSALVYAKGYRNFRSTFSYGHHDVDTKRGGMHQAMQEHPANPCNPDTFMVTGDPCVSKGGIPNIKNIKALKALHEAHKATRAAHGWGV